MPSPKKSIACGIVLNILGYHQDGEWVALALEMDLRGYGETFEAALADLRDLVEMQISFAHFKGHPEMILRPADPIWFSRFAEIRNARLSSMLEKTSHSHGEYEVAGLPIPPAHVIASLQETFTQADA